MRGGALAAMVLVLAAGCSPSPPEPPEAARSEAVPPPVAGVDEAAALQRQALPRRNESVCQLLARRAAEFALAADGDGETFLTFLQEEVVSGADDPFDLKDGLHQGEWSEAYIYEGHGGFRPEFDDAQRYPRGGNHQPGHFVSVLTIAHRFGAEHARVAIGHVGDLEPEQEDDLRLSLRAIQLGTSLGESMTPGQVALAISELCR